MYVCKECMKQIYRHIWAYNPPSYDARPMTRPVALGATLAEAFAGTNDSAHIPTHENVHTYLEQQIFYVTVQSSVARPAISVSRVTTSAFQRHVCINISI